MSYQKRCTIIIPKRKRIPATPPASGFTSIPDGDQQVVFDLEIDTDGLAILLAHKLARSKTGKSRYLSGLIKAVRA